MRRIVAAARHLGEPERATEYALGMIVIKELRCRVAGAERVAAREEGPIIAPDGTVANCTGGLLGHLGDRRGLCVECKRRAWCSECKYE